MQTLNKNETLLRVVYGVPENTGTCVSRGQGNIAKIKGEQGNVEKQRSGKVRI